MSPCVPVEFDLLDLLPDLLHLLHDHVLGPHLRGEVRHRPEDMVITAIMVTTVPLYLASVTTWDSSRWNLLV